MVSENERGEIDALKRHGWTDDEIDAMSPATRREEFAKAVQMHPVVEDPVQDEVVARVFPALPNRLGIQLTLFAGTAITLCAVLLRLSDSSPRPPTILPEWENLLRCSYMASFDGKRRLILAENHYARIETDEGNTDGSWSFSQESRKYLIAVGEPFSYSVITPGDGADCMLIAGDFRTADLTKSWFPSRPEPDDGRDRELP